MECMNAYELQIPKMKALGKSGAICRCFGKTVRGGQFEHVEKMPDETGNDVEELKNEILEIKSKIEKREKFYSGQTGSVVTWLLRKISRNK